MDRDGFGNPNNRVEACALIDGLGTTVKTAMTRTPPSFQAQSGTAMRTEMASVIPPRRPRAVSQAMAMSEIRMTAMMQRPA